MVIGVGDWRWGGDAEASTPPASHPHQYQSHGFVFANPSDDEIRALLSRRLNIAVVGCSPNPSRDSHRIARLLIERGHRVFPVNPQASGEILGRAVHADVRDVTEPIDMVDIFRRSDQVGPIVDAAIAIGAKVVWMQLEVIDEAAAARAQQAGLMVVMDRCPAIEYRRLFASSSSKNAEGD